MTIRQTPTFPGPAPRPGVARPVTPPPPPGPRSATLTDNGALRLPVLGNMPPDGDGAAGLRAGRLRYLAGGQERAVLHQGGDELTGPLALFAGSSIPNWAFGARPAVPGSLGINTTVGVPEALLPEGWRGLARTVQLTRTSDDGTGVRLTLDGGVPGAGNVPIVPANTSVHGFGFIRGRQYAGSAGTESDSAHWWFYFVIMRRATAASTFLLGCEQITPRSLFASPNPGTVGLGAMVPNRASDNGNIGYTNYAGDNWRCQVTADTGFGALNITCTGQANKSIRWDGTLLWV